MFRSLGLAKKDPDAPATDQTAYEIAMPLDPFPFKPVGKRFDFSAGPGAQVEVSGRNAPYKISWMLQWKPAIRSPLRVALLEQPAVQTLRNQLAKLKKILNENDRSASRRRGAGAVEQRQQKIKQAQADLESLGRLLHRYIVLTPEIEESLKQDEQLFLEIGLDESLNEFPLELMHDESYLCLRHNIGRYVVSSRLD